MDQPEPEFLTTSAVAQIIGRTPARVRQLERDGVLPARHATGGVRLFDRASVEAYLRQRDASGSAPLAAGGAR